MTALTDAACRGVNTTVFYPATSSQGHHAHKRDDLDIYQQALDICARCTVRDQCLADALDRQDRYGVWGGTTPHDRHRILTQRGAA